MKKHSLHPSKIALLILEEGESAIDKYDLTDISCNELQEIIYWLDYIQKKEDTYDSRE